MRNNLNRSGGFLCKRLNIGPQHELGINGSNFSLSMKVTADKPLQGEMDKKEIFH